MSKYIFRTVQDPTHLFELERGARLNGGAASDVYAAQTPGSLCVIKVYKERARSQGAIEWHCAKKLCHPYSHPNVVAIVGAAFGLGEDLHPYALALHTVPHQVRGRFLRFQDAV